jgi:hypothetical protein
MESTKYEGSKKVNHASSDIPPNLDGCGVKTYEMSWMISNWLCRNNEEPFLQIQRKK